MLDDGSYLFQNIIKVDKHMTSCLFTELKKAFKRKPEYYFHFIGGGGPSDLVGGGD